MAAEAEAEDGWNGAAEEGEEEAGDSAARASDAAPSSTELMICCESVAVAVPDRDRCVWLCECEWEWWRVEAEVAEEEGVGERARRGVDTERGMEDV